MAIACDLCKERSNQIFRADSLAVCQWCLSNGVLDHALEVDSRTTMLSEAVRLASLTHQNDVANRDVAQTQVESAYAAFSDLTGALNNLADSTAKSRETLRLEQAARLALTAYIDEERAKTLSARQSWWEICISHFFPRRLSAGLHD